MASLTCESAVSYTCNYYSIVFYVVLSFWCSLANLELIMTSDLKTNKVVVMQGSWNFPQITATWSVH